MLHGVEADRPKPEDGVAADEACPSRSIKAQDIEAAVWDHVAALLADPERLLAQFDRLAAAGEAGTARDRVAEQQLRVRLERGARADKRLLDAYKAGVVSLAELTERRHRLAEERHGLERQWEERLRLRRKRAQAETVRTSLAAFCARIRSRLNEATFDEKQGILQLVIERIVVGNGRLEIRHVIPLRPPQPGSDGPVPSADRLRSDRVHDAGLDLGLREHGADRLGEALQPVDDGDQDVGDAAVAQLVHDAQPELGALGLLEPEAEHLLGAVGAQPGPGGASRLPTERLTACRKSNADPCTKVTRYLGNRERYKVMQRDLCTGAGLRVTERELLTWFEGLHE